MLRFSLFGVSALSLFLGVSLLRADAPTPDDALWLKVKGPNIVTSPTSDGGERPFVPVGIGYCRDVIIRAQDDEVMKFCKAHSLNTVRLCFYVRLFNGRKDKPIDIDQHLRDFVDPVVQSARRNGIYVILDDHEYLSSQIDELNARGKQKTVPWNEEEMQQWTDGWAKVAQRYRDEPYVLGYEVMNEPHGIAPEEAREKLTRALKAIRAVDTRHIVILGNCDWSHSRTMEPTWGPVASTVDSPYNNVAFSFHDYPQDDYPWKVQKSITTFRDAHQVPVLCTEFGATHWNKSETVCREHEAGLLALFAQERVGWMIWALKVLQDNPRNSYNETDKVGFGPPKQFDSCAYSDLWPPVARIMASPMPTKGKAVPDAAASK
ncbi:Aryl-phospho-beta-D-glucosidase BglC, GH1 family [Verrucomicrobium sp. GAS474]|uniref:glycoside hydrolase family 5 protein n=1 Tax=Verrucomicrobium sp. GAS474 TaxID=1882831 RepID=UPI00087D97EA|nr:cellulase family glycosylhydrolase [Verrucomicrobium sp. GAS474]SDT89144.1 Aryl-phospho-beta-D-glucosidase BglC, GH1 family [Verrucomicrobium sp. GAS474]